jgi:peptide/nickel transport system ATP-binding protein
MSAALVVRDLSVSLRGQSLLTGVSFFVGVGERVALLGASGSGKSLTAAAILGQLHPDMTVSGSMAINGRDLPMGPRALGEPGEFAMVHQDPATAWNPMVRIGRQLAFPLLKTGLSRSQARTKAVELLANVGMTDPAGMLSRFSGELSGGQLQRVTIALALACRATVLIADEPTTALDVISQGLVLQAIRDEAEDHGALLFITHDLSVAASLCTRAVVMDAGKVVEQAPMEQLLAAPEHSYTRELVNAAQISSRAIRQGIGA